MSVTRVKKAAAPKTSPAEPPLFPWCKLEGEPVGMDPTYALTAALAAKFWPDDLGRQMRFVRNLKEVEAELLDGDESPAARMLVGHLVLTWVHGLWADTELLWETHRVGLAPVATAAMTRRAESLSVRFLRAFKLWESYCLRTRGEAAPFPAAAGSRISELFASRN